MGASLKLVSVNIERSNHLDRVLSFFGRENPDVVCIQELLGRDVPFFERALGNCLVFRPGARWVNDEEPVTMGEAIFSRLPCSLTDVRYYWGSEELRNFDDRSVETKRATQSYAVAFADLEKEGEPFRIATTHFTWTPHGEADDYQRQDVAALLDVLETMGEFVLTGDFNAPRGGEIFSKLAAAYQDNIPATCQTSIDVTLHRNGKVAADELSRNMVDGLFTTPGFRASEVKLEFGVSDHAGVVGAIERV